AVDLGRRDRGRRLAVEQEGRRPDSRKRDPLTIGLDEHRCADEREAGGWVLERGVRRSGPGRWHGDDDLREELARLDGGEKRTDEELGGRDLPLTSSGAEAKSSSQGDQDRGHVGGRVGVDDAASDRAEVAYLEIADVLRALADPGQTRPAEGRGAEQLRPGRQRADAQLAVALPDSAEVEAGDVDHDRRPGDPQLHHGDERLSAGDRLRVLLAQQLERVVEIRRARVARRSGYHAAAPAARIDSTIPS